MISPPVPPRASVGPTAVVLRVPHLHSPTKFGLEDTRILSVAFQELVVGPA